MKNVPGTLREGGAFFASTHWTVVLQAAQESSEEKTRAALEQLCQAYWPPLYTFLRRRGHSSPDAQDLTQAFFVHLLEAKTLARVNREKGRLRSFLLGALQHFLANERDRANSLKRGGGQQIVSMDDHLIEAEASLREPGNADERISYDEQWATGMVAAAWEEVERAMLAEGKAKLLATLKPFVVGGPEAPPSHEEAAAQLGVPISTFRNSLMRLRKRFREAMRAEVARTVPDPAEVDEEMNYLFRVLLA